MSEFKRRTADAIGVATFERAYGCYDYSGYPGDAPPYQVRNEKTNTVVFRSHDRNEAQTVYNGLCRGHLANSAIAAMKEPDPRAVAAVADQLKMDATKVAAVWMLLIDEMLK